MINIFGLNAWRDYDNWDPQAPIVLLFGDCPRRADYLLMSALI